VVDQSAYYSVFPAHSHHCFDDVTTQKNPLNLNFDAWLIYKITANSGHVYQNAMPCNNGMLCVAHKQHPAILLLILIFLFVGSAHAVNSRVVAISDGKTLTINPDAKTPKRQHTSASASAGMDDQHQDQPFERKSQSDGSPFFAKMPIAGTMQPHEPL
jgi:hypothetical protein